MLYLSESDALHRDRPRSQKLLMRWLLRLRPPIFPTQIIQILYSPALILYQPLLLVAGRDPKRKYFSPSATLWGWCHKRALCKKIIPLRIRNDYSHFLGEQVPWTADECLGLPSKHARRKRKPKPKSPALDQCFPFLPLQQL